MQQAREQAQAREQGRRASQASTRNDVGRISFSHVFGAAKRNVIFVPPHQQSSLPRYMVFPFMSLLLL